MDVPTLKLSPRSVTGKKVKTLRRAGLVPVHVYGRDAPPLSLQVDAQVLRRLLPRVGANIPLSVEVEDQEGEDICFVREAPFHRQGRRGARLRCCRRYIPFQVDVDVADGRRPVVLPNQPVVSERTG